MCPICWAARTRLGEPLCETSEDASQHFLLRLRSFADDVLSRLIGLHPRARERSICLK